MKCQRCQSERVATIGAKCSDMCNWNLNGVCGDGYVPDDMAIGSGDYMGFNLCFDCGQLQGKFPLPPCSIEKEISGDEVADFFDNQFSEGEQINLPSRRVVELKRQANELSPKFGNWLEYFFEVNVGMTPPLRFPSCEKFVQMFSSGAFEL